MRVHLTSSGGARGLALPKVQIGESTKGFQTVPISFVWYKHSAVHEQMSMALHVLLWVLKESLPKKAALINVRSEKIAGEGIESHARSRSDDHRSQVVPARARRLDAFFTSNSAACPSVTKRESPLPSFKDARKTHAHVCGRLDLRMHA